HVMPLYPFADARIEIDGSVPELGRAPCAIGPERLDHRDLTRHRMHSASLQISRGAASARRPVARVDHDRLAHYHAIQLQAVYGLAVGIEVAWRVDVGTDVAVHREQRVHAVH